MSSYNPPLENLPIFDSSVFNNIEEPLTTSSAGTQFLKYPIAQGTETLSDIIVLGTSSYSGIEIHNNTETHNGQIIANNVITQNNAILNINQTDHTNNNNGNNLRATTFYGDVLLRRPDTINGGAMFLYDVGSNSGKFMQIYQSGNAANIVGQATGGFISLGQLNSIGTVRNIYTGLATGTTIKTYASDGNNITLAVLENDSGKFIGLQPNVQAGGNMPVIAGDNVIISKLGNTPNTTALSIGCQSNISNGIKIDSVNNITTLGQGGVTNGVYSNSFSCSNTASTINGPASFSSTTPPTSAQTIPASNDSSTKIPTTAWVQSAIGSSAPLFFRANLNQQPTVTGTGTVNITFTGGSAVSINDSFTLRYTIRYDYNTTGIGQSIYYKSYYGNMTVWPNRVISNSGGVPVLLNGSIAGNTQYEYVNATNAPNGRYIWTENYSNTQKIDSLNDVTTPVGLTFFFQAQMSLLFNVPYVAPLSSSCSLSVSLELINTCSSLLGISVASSGFSNVNKNF